MNLNNYITILISIIILLIIVKPYPKKMNILLQQLYINIYDLFIIILLKQEKKIEKPCCRPTRSLSTYFL